MYIECLIPDVLSRWLDGRLTSGNEPFAGKMSDLCCACMALVFELRWTGVWMFGKSGGPGPWLGMMFGLYCMCMNLVVGLRWTNFLWPEAPSGYPRFLYYQRLKGSWSAFVVTIDLPSYFWICNRLPFSMARTPATLPTFYWEQRRGVIDFQNDIEICGIYLLHRLDTRSIVSSLELPHVRDYPSHCNSTQS